MYQQMLAAEDYNSAAEYDTLHALAKAEYEEEQAREDAALEYAMEEEHKYDWLNCRTCVTRAMGNCNLWQSVSDEGCNTHPNCPVKQESLKENPCYHCYTGAIGECAMTHCKHQHEPWSKDVESRYLDG